MNAGRLVMRATATRARKARVEARRPRATARAFAAVRAAGFFVVADVVDDDAEALTMPQSPMMTSAAVSPPREPTLSMALTTE